ncbi:hypothetical protein [Tsukamurella pseudospumae]|uniref:Uncharacterized protein n=1 Tax=Tsukamurella pseudospumae TaxID=239498 RepID=A0A137ZRT2_9ACTN|nr:hypothetical protein [Tsukamurella pseudospumae]KXP00897.1 hypothetical protein AXK61_12880 [Tsukamurella pseudospumae]
MTAPAVDAPIVPDDALPAPAAPSGWRGPIMPINERSGDGRIMVLDETITDPPCRPLPLPLSAQKHVDEGHDGAIVVGLIRRVWLQDGHVWAEGTFNDDEDGREWAQRVANGQRWISADLSDIQAEEIPLDEQGAELDVASVEVLDLEIDSLIRVTEWKIMGATLVAGPAFESAHIEAATVEPSGLTASLIAAGIAYDADDFADPKLGELTALQVTDDGRVFGHLAGWRSCHTGFAGACVTAPRSASNYRYFHQGAVRLADGRDLPVGKITLGTGHASTRPGVGATAAAAHYDNTGSAVAVVRCGEDTHGVWVAGRTLPGVSEQRLAELRRSPLSGDWRTVTPGGGLELVAALAVNVPGFPIPRTQSMAASGEMALVAAGIVTPATARAVEASIRKARAGVLAQRMNGIRTRDVRARMSALRVAGLTRRMSLVAAPVEEDGTQLQGGQRIVRTQEGADRYGVEVGQPIPTGTARTQAVEKEWESIKAENPAGSKEGKGSGGSKGSSTKSKDTTTKGQVPSGSKKLGSSTAARKSGDSAFMEEDESPDQGAKGGKLTKFEAGVAYYSDGTMSDGANWYEQGETKATSSKSTKKSGTSTKSSDSTTSGTKSSSAKTSTPVDPISAFVQALTEMLTGKKASTSTSSDDGGQSLPAGPDPQAQAQHERLNSLLDRMQRTLDERDQRDRSQRAVVASGRMQGLRVTALRHRMSTLGERKRWPKGTPGGLGGKFMPGEGSPSGGKTSKASIRGRESKAAAAKRTITELEDAVAALSDPSDENIARFEKAEAAAQKAADAHAAEKARAQARRDKDRRSKQDAMDTLIEKGYQPDEAEAEAFGRPVERIRRREAIATARAEGATVRGFDDAVRALHTTAIAEQYDATEGGTVQGYRLKSKYQHLSEMVLWTSNDATARKYMTDEMAEWFDQNGRITRQVVRDSWLAGRGGNFDTTQQGYYQ